MEKEDPIARFEREKAEKESGSNAGLIVAIVVAVVLGAILAVVATKDYKLVQELEADKASLTEQFTALQAEYKDLSSEYEYINNQLDSSREEVAELIDRIKKTEATNRQKMRAYEKELGTLRSIMRNYVQQIDSLNTQNLRLSSELANNKQALAEAKGKNEQLTAQNKQLSSKVATGSVVKARGISVEAYNASDKTTDRSSRVKRLAVSLSLIDNDLAKKGPMVIYVRVKDPDGNLIVDGSNTSFFIGNEAVAASASREVDYQGEEVDMIIYVNDVEQYVKGIYTVDVFSAQAQLGSTEIVLR